MANKVPGNIARKREIADLDDDITKVENYKNSTEDFETKRAFQKLLIVLKEWKKRGY